MKKAKTKTIFYLWEGKNISPGNSATGVLNITKD